MCWLALAGGCLLEENRRLIQVVKRSLFQRSECHRDGVSLVAEAHSHSRLFADIGDRRWIHFHVPAELEESSPKPSHSVGDRFEDPPCRRD